MLKMSGWSRMISCLIGFYLVWSYMGIAGNGMVWHRELSFIYSAVFNTYNQSRDPGRLH